MPIKGLTDSDELRRDGKIRSGYRDSKANNKPVNTPYFLLHDAPQLIPVLGENPTEFYCTVHSNNPAKVILDDLRWYGKTLLCRSMHDAPDENNRPMGMVAAYSALGSDVSGLTQKPFPRMPNSRVRMCAYRACPDYLRGDCSEHMFLNVIVPQYSLSSLFTIDSTSINAVMNAVSAIKKAMLGNKGGRLRGEIFRVYKKEIDIKYTDMKAGKVYPSKKHVVHVDHVPFEDYEAKFKSQISSDVWERLLEWRGGAFDLTMGGVALTGNQASSALAITGEFDDDGGAPEQEPVKTLAGSVEENDRLLKELLDKPHVTKLFEDLESLMGVDNSVDRRMNTVKHAGTEARLVDFLNKKIKETRKAKGVKAETAPQEQRATKTEAPPASEVVDVKSPPVDAGGPVGEEPLF